MNKLSIAERKDQLYYSITKVAENGGSGLSHESAVLVRDIFIDNCEGDRFFETVIESIGEAQKHIVNTSSILDRKQRKMAYRLTCINAELLDLVVNWRTCIKLDLSIEEVKLEDQYPLSKGLGHRLRFK